jgi:dihydrofolate reductase
MDSHKLKNMRKVIAAINMTIDGFCDHTAGIPDEEIHYHYADLLNNAGVILYGRITYQLMQYWQTLVNNPSGERSMDDFAVAIDKLPKIVFSHTLKNTEWESAKLSNKTIEEEVLELKQSHNHGSKNILVGSRSLIIQLMKLNLIDEYQLCVHPVVAGSGLPLFENINDRTVLKLINTKTFSGGAVTLYYEPTNKKSTNR